MKDLSMSEDSSTFPEAVRLAVYRAASADSQPRTLRYSTCPTGPPGEREYTTTL